MEKTYTTRNKREDNLTTTEAILKVLTRIYWMKKEGKLYFISVICDECKVTHMNKNIVENLYDWKELPTWALAEECRQQHRRHAETWPSSKKNTVELTEDEKTRLKEKAMAEYKEKIIREEQAKADKARQAEEAKAKKAAEKEKARKEEEERKRKEWETADMLFAFDEEDE